MAKRPARDRSRSTRAKRGESEVVVLARQRFEMAQDIEREQRQRELDDLKFYAGDQWPEEIRTARAGQNAQNGLPPVPARPCITISKVREPVRQVLNQEQEAEIGISLVAAEDFTTEDDTPLDETEVMLREGLIRRIQRESQAQDAYTWAFARAVIAGRGYFGIMTRYVDVSAQSKMGAKPRAEWMDQEVIIQRFYNQNSVTLDPAHEQPDGSDAEWGFVSTFMSRDEYAAEFPSREDRPNLIAASTDADFTAFGEEYPDWFEINGDVQTCRVVDYYYTERTSRELVQTDNGLTLWAEDAPKDAKIVHRRQVIHKTIKWCKLDGVNTQPLDETEWPGQYIPLIKVLGEELQPYDKERRAEGMVRPAREANQGFNIMVSKWVEMIGLAPIPAMEIDPEQIEGYEKFWEVMNTRTLNYLPRRTRDDQGQMFAPITATKRDVPIAAVAGSVQLFDAAIKSTTGIPDATLGNVDPSIRSAAAQHALVAQSQHGTSNFLRNLTRSLRHAGVQINDLLYPIYGRPGRIVQIINEEGKPETVKVSDTPTPADQPQPQARRPLVLTESGRFNVAVEVAKNFDTKREQEAAQLGELIAGSPQLLSWFGDIFFQNLDGPGHQELAARAKVMLAPPVQQMLAAKKGGGPNPAMLQQQVTMAQQVIEKAQQEIGQLNQQIQTDAVKEKAETDRELQKTKMQADRDITLQRMKDATSITVAKINALTKGVVSDNEAQVEAIALAHDAEQAELERQHQLGLNRADAAHAQDMAREGHVQTLEQSAQQAALAPPAPEAEPVPEGMPNA